MEATTTTTELAKKKAKNETKRAGAAKAKKQISKEGSASVERETSVTARRKNSLSPSMNRHASPVVGIAGDEAAVVRGPTASAERAADSSDQVQCKHCKKNVAKAVAGAHAKACLKEKQERAKKKKEAREAAARAKEQQKEEAAAAGQAKAGPDDVKEEDNKAEPNAAAGAEGETAEKTKTTTGAATTTTTTTTTKKAAAGKAAAKAADEGNKKSKKRKADSETAEKAPKPKKKKEEPKPKVPKPKGPVDVERQCGVLLPNGSLCARSLTCKSHSMGAKRGVPGRSLPYDMLLHAYQKKNQAKQQKAAIDANAPLPDELDQNGGPIDSDEEKDAIMAAIARSRPQPLERCVLVPIRRKYQYVRMKEMLSTALGGSRGRGLFAVGDASARGSVAGLDAEMTG